MFGDNVIDKRKFYYSKYTIDINNVHIDKILISNNVSFGKKVDKYFIGYIQILQMIKRVKQYTQCILLPKQDQICKNLMKVIIFPD